MSLAPGQSLSHYRLVDRIGEGGMGVVWKATDTTLGREVAIKVLPEAFARDPERMARFEREAKILAALNHPNIAAVYGLDSAEGVRFLVLELVEGKDLAQSIAHGALAVVETIEIAQQIAEALEAAHEKGIIHRDLKPANVKVTPDGRVKVLDFGLAKALEGDTATAASATLSHSPTITGLMTGANVILGTAAYMSPEQARGRAVDRRADIWAFGCVVYECLTGRRAFVGETVSDTLAKILEREPDLGALPGVTPPRVRELIVRCLAKDPKLRLRDIGDARIVLDEVLAARSPSGRLIATETAGEASGRRHGWGLPMALAGLAGLGVGAGAWALFGSQGTVGAAREPSCLTVTMPPDVDVQSVLITMDGRTVIVSGQPKGSEGPASVPRVYTRRLDGYEFSPVPGTEGALGIARTRDNRGLIFLAPVSPGAPQLRLARVPIDGSAPPTTFVDWKDSWSDGVELESGDFLIRDGLTSFVRIPKGGGAPAPPIRMESGRSGVSRYEISGRTLPGDRGAFVNVVSYDARGWHYSVGVLDPKNGKVKVIEEDGGNGVYTPAGQLLFARGDAILAAPFDLRRVAESGPAVAVWSGLSTAYTFYPGGFALAQNGTLSYRPGQLGGDRQISLLDAAGKLEPWSSERRPLNSGLEISPDGRSVACSGPNARGIDEVWISDLAHPDFRRLGTDPNADCSLPVWSPDGRRIAYQRLGKDDRDGLYVQGVDGGSATRILRLESDHVAYDPASWLPDGTALLAVRRDQGTSSLVYVPLLGTAADSARARPLLPSAFTATDPRVSPDGRLLAFASNESGKLESYVVELHPDGSTGRPVRVGARVGGPQHWSADGRTLFVADERGRLMKTAIARTPVLSCSAPTEVCDLDKLGIALWIVLPDGRFLVALKNDNETAITRYNVVLNWGQALERKLRRPR